MSVTQAASGDFFQRVSNLEYGLRGNSPVQLDGVWLAVTDLLRQNIQKATGKKASPTVQIIDNEWISTAQGDETRGYDAGGKITGSKRHFLVDKLGMFFWCLSTALKSWTLMEDLL